MYTTEEENFSLPKAFGEEHPDCKLIVVSLEERPRMMNGMEICNYEGLRLLPLACDCRFIQQT